MALLVCLLFLTALMLLALSAASEAILQTRLAENLQEAERARQAARAALWWAENWLLEMQGDAPVPCDEACTGLRLHARGNLPPDPERQGRDWWLQHGHEAGVDPLSGARLATVSGDSLHPGLWLVEESRVVSTESDGTPQQQTWYRVLARGHGRTAAGISVAESTLVRSWPAVGSGAAGPAAAAGRCPGAEPAAPCGRRSWRELR